MSGAGKKFKAVVLGFGAVGTRVAELLVSHASIVPGLTIVGVSDSSGGVYSPEGLDLSELLEHKKRAGVSTYEASNGKSQVVRDSAALYELATSTASDSSPDLDLLIDLSPVNLKNGEPSLPLLRHALRNGVSAVLANKAPLVLDFAGLKDAAASSNDTRAISSPHTHLAFSATVCGGLPVVNVGTRDLRGATFKCIEGIFNSTSNYILAEMEAGRSREDALMEAQRVGIAEADPTLDIEGLDTANKLVILSNEVLGKRIKLEDVKIRGITNVTDEEVRSALNDGECIRLVARAAADQNLTYRYTVTPERVKLDSHLGSCRGTSMCCRYVTDIFETIDLCTDEKGVWPTAAAVLRDCYDVLYMRP